MKKTVYVADRAYTSSGVPPKIPVSVSKAPWDE
jgi:hypothetical protein